MRPPLNSAMFGLTAMSPWPIRGSSSAEIVGWASASLWSGSGSPKSIGSPVAVFSARR